MSLKQKSEAALLAMIPAGSFTGTRLRSDENQQTTLGQSTLSAIYTATMGRPNSKGIHSGQESGLLSLVLRTSADNQEEQATPPETLHATNVDNVRAAVVVANFVALLNAAATQPYTLLIAKPTASPRIEPVARTFRDIWSWEIVHVEVNCA